MSLMNTKYIIKIESPPDRDDLVASIIYNNTQVAEIRYESKDYFIEVYSTKNEKIEEYRIE